MKNRKEFLRIGPDFRDLEPGGAGERAEAFDAVLVGKLGNNFFARGEGKLALPEVNGLIGFADQVHLNPGGVGIVNRAVPPLLEVEIRPDLAIRAHEQIEIELGRNAGAVVVG